MHSSKYSQTTAVRVPRMESQAERDLLFAVLWGNSDTATLAERETARSIIGAIRAEYFIDEQRQRIASTLIGLTSRGETPSISVIETALRPHGNECCAELTTLFAIHRSDASVAWQHNLRLLREAHAHNTGQPPPAPLRSSKSERIGRAKLIRLSDVVPEQVQWLWHGRIPLGKVSQFAGNGGLGKSFVSLDIAARVTRGARWPDDGAGYAPLGNVIILNAEDGLADQIRPRLDALGADTEKVLFLEAIQYPDHEKPFSLAADTEQLREAIETVSDVRLVIIDPISSYLGAIDANKSADVRMVLDPLKRVAERSGAAILLINHLTKGSGPAVYRACGSIAIQSMVRTSWAFAEDENDPARREILPTKNNVGPDARGIAYRIVDGRVVWDDAPVTRTADEALEHRPSQGRASGESLNAASEWLRERLAGGAMESGILLPEAEQAGHRERTIWRAKKELGIVARRDGGRGGVWLWELPASRSCGDDW